MVRRHESATKPAAASPLVEIVSARNNAPASACNRRPLGGPSKPPKTGSLLGPREGVVVLWTTQNLSYLLGEGLFELRLLLPREGCLYNCPFEGL